MHVVSVDLYPGDGLAVGEDGLLLFRVCSDIEYLGRFIQGPGHNGARVALEVGHGSDEVVVGPEDAV